MKFFLPFSLCLFLISCNNSAEKSEIKPSYDSVDIVSFATFDEQSFRALSLPLKIDTVFIQNADSSERISFQQLRSLKSNFMFSEFPSSAEYDFNTFCMIDSLKFNKAYDSYLSKLDIGMTKTCIAYKLGFARLNENIKLFVWGITQSSYEACPFFSGTSIIGTFVNAKNESKHLLLGTISSFGDPPATGSEEITSVISKNKISINGKTISDDLDIPGEETTIQSVTVEISDTLKFVSPFKKVSNTEELTKQE